MIHLINVPFSLWTGCAHQGLFPLRTFQNTERLAYLWHAPGGCVSAGKGCNQPTRRLPDRQHDDSYCVCLYSPRRRCLSDIYICMRWKAKTPLIGWKKTFLTCLKALAWITYAPFFIFTVHVFFYIILFLLLPCFTCFCPLLTFFSHSIFIFFVSCFHFQGIPGEPGKRGKMGRPVKFCLNILYR